MRCTEWRHYHYHFRYRYYFYVLARKLREVLRIADCAKFQPYKLCLSHRKRLYALVHVVWPTSDKMARLGETSAAPRLSPELNSTHVA